MFELFGFSAIRVDGMFGAGLLTPPKGPTEGLPPQESTRLVESHNLQEQLTAARREIQRDLPKEAARELKESRWLWLTNPENLDEDQRQRLTELKSKLPRLAQLADQREALRPLFEDRSLATAAAGFACLTQWLDAARALSLTALHKFCGTLARWQDKIANDFVSRSSNGPTEGFNNGLRTILRRSFAMLNFRHFRLRVLDAFGKPRPQESTGVAENRNTSFVAA